ncbi:MAG: PAS domain S-box protein [Bryobacteraceae bacterium]
MESAAATAAGRHDNAGTELYRSLLDPCPAPVLVARDGFITYANPAARTMLRADSVEILGFALLSLVPSRLKEAFRTYLEAAAATSEPRPFLTSIFQRFDGSLAFVEITAWLVSSDSAPALAISFSPSREREFETLAEHAPDLIARFDRQCRHLYVNPVIARITGISRDAFLGRTLAEAGVPPDESELWDSKLGEAFEAKRETTFECGFTGPNGTILLQAKLVPECNADGEVVTVASVARDITAEKAGETELRRAKARISDILASMTESFIALDRDWRIVYVSRRVQERLGQPLLGRDLWEVVPEARETAFWTGYHRVMEERIPLAFEVCYPNGEWYEVHAAPTEEGLSAYVLNITERKRIEDALRESEEQRRLALEVARVGSYDWDLRRGLIRLDARCREFCGLEQETVEPREILARIHPSDRRAVEVGLARSLDPSIRGEAQLEFRILLPEGRTRWVLLRARTVFRSVF